MLVPVLLSGGFGSRLWPQSRRQYPKQFITFNSEYTLFQETLLRLKGIPDLLPPIIVANHDHRFIIAEQLRQTDQQDGTIILEPLSANTAPAITMAVLHAVKAHGDMVQLLILPSDHVIRNKEIFHQTIDTARTAAAQQYLVTFGVVPVYAETGYGYIKRKPFHDKNYALIEKFVEKPDKITAESYLASGDYYWNSGMFLFDAKTYLQQINEHQPQILHCCREALNKAVTDLHFICPDKDSFAKCPADSIDYALLEKSNKTAVVPLDAGWSDVGSWLSVWNESQKDTHNNVIEGDVITLDTKDSYIRSEHKLIATLGVSELIITESDDAILIANKSHAQHVKKVVQQLKQQNRKEMNQHRKTWQPWGSSDLIDKGFRFKVNHVTVKPGEKISLHKHYNRTEHWIVVQGTAKVYCDDEFFILSENESTYVKPGIVHRLENPGKIDLKIIEIQSGEYLNDDDTERLENA